MNADLLTPTLGIQENEYTGAVTLPPVPYTGRSDGYYSPLTNAHCYEGPAAASEATSLYEGATVACDIETNGQNRFDIRCVTFAWDTPSGTKSLFFDPREPRQFDAVRYIIAKAGYLVLHNATFDIPPLVQARLMRLDDCFKVYDTLVLSRMRKTADRGGRTLDDLVTELTDFPSNRRKITAAFSTMGHSTMDAGYAAASTPDPVWRAGAMADTVATLRLLTPLYNAVVAEQTDFSRKLPYQWLPHTHDVHVRSLIEREQLTNRVMLYSSAIGMPVDTHYLESYKAEHAKKVNEFKSNISAYGLDPDAGNISSKLVEMLYDRGELPDGWERTGTGALKADKKALSKLDHPLVEAVTTVKNLAKVTGYLEKVSEMADATGRIHPQVGVLGAHATGRMSYSNPEIQQFPSDARGILAAEPGRGLTSIDWSSIEPVMVGHVAQDWTFLGGYLKNEDLYLDPARFAGLIPRDLSDEEAMHHPGRKQAKIVVLANTYGQGKALMAKNLGLPLEEATRVQENFNNAMPEVVKFLSRARTFATDNGFIRTIDGRCLSIPKDTRDGFGKDQFMGYKAMNYVVQGSAYSLLSETINNIYKAGYHDALKLAIHDELVVDTEAAADIQKIMITPPAWLNAAAGREVILRSDSNDMGTCWKYV